MAFATAGAANIALLGRTMATLQDTAESVKSSSKTSVSVHVADLNNLKSLESAAAAIGTWNVFVLSSGYCPTPAAVPSTDAAEWWKGFEVRIDIPRLDL